MVSSIFLIIIIFKQWLWFQVFLSNTNDLPTIIWFQVILSKANSLYTILWFQVFLFNTNSLYTITSVY